MRRRRGFSGTWAVLLACSLAISACTCLPKGQADLDVGMKERGMASWYGEDFHGWLTANGEIYDMETLTAAHRTLPLGTVVRVTNVENGRKVRVRINDRGPYLNGRILDLSLAAARELDMVENGIAAIQLEVVADQHVELLAPDSHASRAFSRWLRHPVGQAAASADADGAFLAQPKEVRAVRAYPNDAITQRRIRRVTGFLAAGRRSRTAALPTS